MARDDRDGEVSRAPAFEVVERAVATGPLVGAAAAIGDRGQPPCLHCVGCIETDGSPVRPDTWYDLASLTKVLCTAALCLEEIAAGRLDPLAPIREILPETAWLQPAPNLGTVTVLELAAHASGLPAWQPLYTYGLDRSTLEARVLHSTLSDTRGHVLYSDLGYMVLGFLLERLCNAPLNVLAARFFDRLGLGHALAFSPPPDAQVAPTERDPWRGRLVRGEVHDENAYALGGVAGHAGLFGSLEGVAGFMAALVEGRVHAPAALRYLATTHARGASPDVPSRGFGWILGGTATWSGGTFTSAHSIGHAGFTGTGAWADLDTGRWTVLLTNRVYPTRYGSSDAAIQRLRRLFNNAAHGSL